jgi:hypothetical protein
MTGPPPTASPPLTINAPVEDVPQSNRFVRGSFFVRDCYPAYYDKIIESLTVHTSTKRLISVTGTPGIGKSIFYLYFFLKYKKEHPDERLLTASYTKERKLEECKLWKSANEVNAGCKDGEDPLLVKEYESIPKDACALYLYDGPPDMKPKGSSTKMIAFTCPNAGWFGMTSKYEEHSKVYMPNWTLSEIEMANDALQLKLAQNDLKVRFDLFGGTVRYTLVPDATFVEDGRSYIQTALSKISTIDQVRDCFEGTSSLDQIVHRLMHYNVCETDWTKATLKPASKFVAALMQERLDKKLDSDRRRLMHWLDGAGSASAFAGWLFENFVHEIFLKGVSFSMRSLGESTGMSALDIDATAGFYRRFKLEVPLEDVFLRVYQMPESSTLQALDSYILTKDGLWMFQVTRAMNHDVDLEGILKLLEFLGVIDKVRENPNFAKLVFVVPLAMSGKFSAQKITKDPIFQGMSEPAVLAADCSMVPGIKMEKNRKLTEIGINNIGELLADNSERTSFTRSAVRKFRSNLKSLKDADFIESLPQYVIGVDYGVTSVG